MTKRKMFCIYVLIVTVLACGTFVFGYACAKHIKVYKPQEQPLPTKQTITEQVDKIQRQVGCEKLDAYTANGPIGPEFTQKVNAAIQAERPELFNQYANRYMTETGAPK